MKNKGEVIKGNEKKTWKVEEVFEWNGFKCAILFHELDIIDDKMKKHLTSFSIKCRCEYVGLEKGHT